MSRSWRDDKGTGLVSVIITRDLGGLYIAHIILVDRTCLGIKNAFTRGPLSRSELLEGMEQVGRAHAEGMEPVASEDAQSVVFAALAYAERLGFRPNRDFDARLIGPAPSPLRPTPLAARPRPLYVPGPSDNVLANLAALRRAVGEDGFDFHGYIDVDPDDFDDDDLDDDDLDDGELEESEDDAEDDVLSARARD